MSFASTSVAPQARPRPKTDVPCAHCGLPVGGRPVEGRLPFCCTGCAVVYEALQAAGMGETFYRLRDVAPSERVPRPARIDPNPLGLAELDDVRFLEAHTRPAGEGLREAELFLDGVHCAACVWLVERLPYEMGGVQEARLDLARARLTLRFQPDAVRLSDVARWLARFGYEAHPVRGREAERRTSAERRLLVRLGVCWALAGNVMLLAFAFYSGLGAATDPALATAARWLSFALAVPAVAYGAGPFFRRAALSLRLAFRTGDPTRLHIDTPIALGIGVGFGHSAWSVVSGRGEVWFDSITVLIAALLTARWLQLRSRRLAGDATERLLALIPQSVRRVGADGRLAIVRADEIEAGDVVEVPAGEVVPVDGVVESGRSSVNRSALTGESRPEGVGPGAAVEAGITNLSSPLRVRVEAAGEATRVGRLLAWVQGRARRKASVEDLADRLGGYFTLAVLGLAALTVAAWGPWDASESVRRAVALLVITCPCALGMATPLAVAVATGKAARRGLFIKSGGALDRLTRVDAVVLDKTGTLTEGHMALAAWHGSEVALERAAALEAESNHPIAAALVAACPLGRTSVHPCRGVRGRRRERRPGARRRARRRRWTSGVDRVGGRTVAPWF